MATVSVEQITDDLKRLPPEKLAVVQDFVAYLAERELPIILEVDANALECTLASESALRENWDRPEEDAAWAHL